MCLIFNLISLVVIYFLHNESLCEINRCQVLIEYLLHHADNQVKQNIIAILCSNILELKILHQVCRELFNSLLSVLHDNSV